MSLFSLRNLFNSTALSKRPQGATGRIALYARSHQEVRFNHTAPGQKHETGQILPTFSPSTYTPGENLSSEFVNKRLSRSILNEFPEAEVKTRIELAAAYWLFDHFGWNEAIFNHFTAQVIEPDGSKSFLINPHGLRYDEVTASSFLKIDLDGRLVHPGVIGDVFGVNKAGFIIHSAIHRVRGDSAAAIAHNHQPSVTGISCTEDAFIPALCQTSQIVGEPAYHDFEGIATDAGEQERLAKDLGDRNVLFLRNHGVLTTGSTIGAAWITMYQLIRAGEIQLAAQTAGKISLPAQATLKSTQERVKHFTSNTTGQLEFAAYMRLLDKLDSSYRL